MDLEAIKKRAHTVWLRTQVCSTSMTQEEADIANLLRHLDAIKPEGDLRTFLTSEEWDALIAFHRDKGDGWHPHRANALERQCKALGFGSSVSAGDSNGTGALQNKNNTVQTNEQC